MRTKAINSRRDGPRREKLKKDKLRRGKAVVSSGKLCSAVHYVLGKALKWVR